MLGHAEANMADHRYAHTVPGQPQDAWEPLETHLRLVATGASDFPGAAGFAAAFGAEACGRTLGLWHDLGKYSIAFQNYLKSSEGSQAHLENVPGRWRDMVKHQPAFQQKLHSDDPGRTHVEHSALRASLAHSQAGSPGQALAFAIAGYHISGGDIDRCSPMR